MLFNFIKKDIFVIKYKVFFCINWFVYDIFIFLYMCNSYYKDENIYIRMKNCLIIFYFIS